MSNVKKDIKTKERVKTTIKIETPKKYQVLIHNNDAVHFDAVFDVLQNVFNLDKNTSYSIMMECHNNGTAQCFIGTKTQSEEKIEQAKIYCEKQHSSGFEFLNYIELEFSSEELD